MNFFGKKQESPSGDEVIADGTNDLRFDDAKSDYLYLDLLPEEMPDEQWAKIKVMMNFFKTNHHSPAVITGDLELDATTRSSYFWRRRPIITFMMNCIIVEVVSVPKPTWQVSYKHT